MIETMTNPTNNAEWRARFEAIERELRAAEQEVQKAQFKRGRIKDRLTDCQIAWDKATKARVEYL